MEKIIKALKELGQGSHKMETLANKIGGGTTAMEVGRKVGRLAGTVVDGQVIRIDRSGRWVKISLDNDEPMRGENGTNLK